MARGGPSQCACSEAFDFRANRLVAVVFEYLIDQIPRVGAIVASPTFSLPENIGGTRNWYVLAHTIVYHSVNFVGLDAKRSGIIGKAK